MACYTALVIVQPTLLEALLDNLASDSPSAAVGFPLAAGIFACAAVSSVSVHKFWFDAQRAGMRVTAALSTEVFRRTMALGPVDRAGYGTGQLTQLMGVDSERLTSGMVLPMLIWGSWPPLVMLVVGLSNLYRLLGWPALVAAALLGSMPFVNAGCLSVRIRNAQSRVQAARDDRIRAATEVLSNVRSLKVLGWEGPSLERVFGLRRKELRAIRTDLLWRVTSALLVVLVPAVATCVSFALYAVVLGKPMAAATVFTATAWIGTLQGPMWQIPSAIRAAATASVSFERLANFFWRTGVVTPLRLLEGDPEEPPAVQWDGTDVLWPSTAAEGADTEEGGEDSERPAPDGCCDKGSRLSLMTARLVAAAACCCCPPGRSRTPPAAAADLLRGVPAPEGDMGEGGATSSAGAPAAAAVLRNVRLRLGPGLNIVLGATGAGKSSLLASLTGAPIVRGSPPAVRGQTAFVGQRPWLLNATVRENITFVSPFRRAWFDRVVDACALREDMAFFPKGEDTQIGERGISISGGQRARIAIARALYSEAKVVLLDDPLAALDAAVARHVLEHCVLALMARQGAVVVMGTNLLSLARHPEAVSVALLESGKGGDGASGLRVIAKSELASLRLESEAPAQLETASTLDVPRAAAAGAADAADAGDAAETASTGSRSPSVRGGLPVPSLSASAKRQPDDGKALVGMSDAMERSEHTLLSPQRPALGALAGSSATQVEAFADRMAYAADMLRSTSATEAGDAKDRGSGTAAPVSGRGQGAEEASQSGFVRLRVFWRYCAACGPAAFTVTYALALAVREVSLLGSDLFLTVWVNSAKGNATAPDPAGGGSGNAASAGAFDGGLLLGGICTDVHDAECFAVVYSLFQSATVFMAVLMWLLGVLGSLSASRRLHDSLMTSLLLASQSFFDATPSGLVVNRAVKDMQMVDLSVATNVRTFVFNVLRLLSATILVAAGSPWVLAAMAVLALPYYALALRFRHAARDLQRLSSASNSPLLSLFGETAGGAHVMRAFGSGAKFLARHRVLAMSYTTRSMLLMAVEQWATVWLEVFGSVVVLATAVMLVVARLEGAIPVAIVGFLLTQAQSVPSRLLWVTRNFASLELALVSAERVFEFVDLPDESRSAGSSPAERTKSWCSRMCSCCGKQIEPADDGSATEALLADASIAEAAEALGVVGAGGRCSLPAWAKAGRTGTTGVDRAAPRGSGKGARLELAGVRLQYDETTAPALRGVHIDLPAGCKAAVVGRSGAGKSSLLAAILQTHAFSGDVRVAGKSLVPAGPWEARKHFAPLSQDAAVFEATVRENVMGFGQDPSALADDTCRKALREVGLSTRLPDLDEGLQSSGSLSRGEAQLLGLARCLARAWTLGCGVVLADEATSSVDRGADTRVHDVLFGLPQTVVSICHRLDHISRFDHVVVMHEGVASEQGPPAELLADPSSRLSSLMEHYRASHEREHTA